MATPKRPLSPFMIGPYYRPQITSMMSITHRLTGLLIALGGFGLAWWLFAASLGGESYAAFQACMGSLPGKAALFLVSAALVYHFLNGIRHLFWDAGRGFTLPQAYASGYTVIVLSVLLTAGLWWLALGGVA